MADDSAQPRASWPVPVIIALLVISGLFLLTREDGDTKPVSETKAPVAEKVNLKKLKMSSTHTRTPAAPKDKRRDKVPAGAVVHPKRLLPVYDAPDGKPFAKIGPKQFGEAWFPVIARSGDWVQVMLPSKPNGSTGWLRGSELREARSSYLVKIHLGSRSLELWQDNSLVGTWTVAVGAEGTPTPTGRTFVLGQIIDDKQPFSPVILPLGSHSDTLDNYGGGKGTVALHGWTNPSVFGQAISHGCVRVPDDALDLLRTVPTGTSVMVDKS